jgi:cell division protein FtsA
MNASGLLLGVDVGTTKVAAVIGGRGASTALLGAACVPCQGLRRGTVVDVEETTRAIIEAVDQAQQLAGAQVDSAWVGVTGQHMSCLNARAELHLPKGRKQISWGDVEKVMASAVAAVSIPPDRQMIHAISRGFWVDGEPRVRNPVGLSATRLAVDTHIVTASRNLIENVVRCVDRAGLSVAELVAEPLATADAVLTEEEEELGVLLVDIGGGTTDIALFLEGSITFTGAAPVAGNFITHDIAVALGVPHSLAEQLKLAYGGAKPGQVPEEDFIVLDEQEERRVRRRFLCEVIGARVEEMFRLVGQTVEGAEGRWPPPGGVVITGGGSLLPGVTSVAEEVLGCRARLGRPRVATGPLEMLETPALATGVGLVYYAHREAESRRNQTRRPVRVLPVLGRVVAWVRDLFSS